MIKISFALLTSFCCNVLYLMVLLSIAYDGSLLLGPINTFCKSLADLALVHSKQHSASLAISLATCALSAGAT